MWWHVVAWGGMGRMGWSFNKPLVLLLLRFPRQGLLGSTAVAGLG